MKTPSAGLSGRAASVGVLRTRRAIIKYLLGPFRFTTDQATPLTSPYTEGGAVGSLTVTDTGNKLSISGGKLVFGTTTVVPDPQVIGPSSARATGRAVLGTVGLPASNIFRQIGWQRAADTGISGGIYFVATEIRAVLNALQIPQVSTAVLSTTYDTLSIQRTPGLFALIRVAGTTPYTLIWVDNADTTSPLFAAVSEVSAAGAAGMTVDNFRMIDLGTYDSRFATDYGLALNRSTFTAANGTALAAIVPEQGGAWTQNVGTFSILSNTVKVATLGATQSIATVDAGRADVVVEVTYNTSTTFDCVLLVRYSAADNSCWMVQINSTAMILFEYDGTTFTSRANVGGLTNATGTDHRIVIVADGSTVSAYLNNGNKISYSSATRNQTLTKHGIRGSSTTSGGTWDNFIVWPRTITLRGDI